MFNKRKCTTCIYAGTISGHSRKSFPSCDYAIRKHECCVQKDGSDLRGNNSNRCKLYVEKG